MRLTSAPILIVPGGGGGGGGGRDRSTQCIVMPQRTDWDVF